MKDLIRLAVYSGGALVSILILYGLTVYSKISGAMMATLAIVLIVVIPTVLIIAVAKKERAKALQEEEENQNQG